MKAQQINDFQPTRRWMMQGLAASATVLGVPGVPLTMAPRGQAKRFDVVPNQGVFVKFTDGERFTVTAMSASGEELERFERVTAKKVFRLRSQYFQITELTDAQAA